ncbi:MAG: lipid II flippase MurJ, partial [Thermodesulfobacteriota bacterium]
FDALSTRLTAEALLYYSIGLWAFSAVRVVVSTFYALQDTRTPVRMAFIAVIANIGFGIILMRYLAHSGLALATSLSSMLNLVLLMLALKMKLGSMKWREMGSSIIKSTGCSIIMGGVLWISARLFLYPDGIGKMGMLPSLLGVMASGIVCYGVSSYLLRNPELHHLMNLVGRSVKDREP